MAMNAIALNVGCSLTNLDWQVVEIARADGPHSINPDGRFTRFLRDFFGLPIARRLANEKLEGLRRFCVRAWFWDRIGARDLQAFMATGYTRADVFQILAHVAGYRGRIPTIEEQSV